MKRLDRKEKVAVFLDRDGTIIEDHGYLRSPRDVAFIGNAIKALFSLQQYYSLFIVSNQDGVSKGILSLSDVEMINQYFLAKLAKKGIHIKDVYVCPHQRSDNCECIKPKPYFLKLAVRKHGILLPDSYVIGDHPHDIQFANNGGAKGIYVLTGHGEKHLNEFISQPVQIAESIGKAADYILLKHEYINQK